MLQEAEEAEEEATIIFSQIRDVEAVHAKLYKKALDHLIAETCPICNAPQFKFKKVD